MSRPSSMRVDRDARHLSRGAQIDEREQMRVDRVHAAVADQSDEVNGSAALLGRVARLDEYRICEE